MTYYSTVQANVTKQIAPDPVSCIPIMFIAVHHVSRKVPPRHPCSFRRAFNQCCTA
jgi:hypothetical protein